MDNYRKIIEFDCFTDEERVHLSSVIQFIENLDKLTTNEKVFSKIGCIKINFDLSMPLSSSFHTQSSLFNVVDTIELFDKNNLKIDAPHEVNEFLLSATPLNRINSKLVDNPKHLPVLTLSIYPEEDWKSSLKNTLFSKTFVNKIETALLSSDLVKNLSSSNKRLKI